MGIVVFFVLAAISVGIIAYPLLPGRATAQPTPAMTDAEIERAVRDLRRTRNVRRAPGQGGLRCPACGNVYQKGDLFCVRCGSGLPEVEEQAEPEELACPSCGASLHEGDRFCAKCGHGVSTEEGA